jgi:hypothetical protein
MNLRTPYAKQVRLSAARNTKSGRAHGETPRQLHANAARENSTPENRKSK